MKFILTCIGFLLFTSLKAQVKWQNVDDKYGPLPASVHVYYTNERNDTAAFQAYYVVADLKDKSLSFETDTTLNRRLTPNQFYKKNNSPLVVVNGSFFSFETNHNLNLVMMEGKIVAYDNHIRKLKGRDTLLYAKYLASAIGITKTGKADVAWIYDDSSSRFPIAYEGDPFYQKDSVAAFPQLKRKDAIRKWKMQTAMGGGPVLVQGGKVRITNNEELKFGGKAINDKHPRTAMGYTGDGKLIILAVQGRSESASGATLGQEAILLKDLGCVEAINLDGGGSSCLLVNGKETIKPSDKEGQRPVPAVFIIRNR